MRKPILTTTALVLGLLLTGCTGGAQATPETPASIGTPAPTATTAETKPVALADPRERLPEEPFGMNAKAIKAVLSDPKTNKTAKTDDSKFSGTGTHQAEAVKLYLQAKWLGIERNALLDHKNFETVEAHLLDVETFVIDEAPGIEFDFVGQAKKLHANAKSQLAGKPQNMDPDVSDEYVLYPGYSGFTKTESTYTAKQRADWPGYIGSEHAWLRLKHEELVPFTHDAKPTIKTKFTEFDNGGDLTGNSVRIRSTDTYRAPLADGRTAVIPYSAGADLQFDGKQWRFTQLWRKFAPGGITAEGKKSQ